MMVPKDQERLRKQEKELEEISEGLGARLLKDSSVGWTASSQLQYEDKNEQKGVLHLYFIIPYQYLLKCFWLTAHHQFCIINRKREKYIRDTRNRLYTRTKRKKKTKKKFTMKVNKKYIIIKQQF